MKKDAQIRLPKKFHRILKMEAVRHDKPMTKYMECLAEEIETKYGSIENYFKKTKTKDDPKKKKGFGLSF